MEIIVKKSKILKISKYIFKCTLGKNGVTKKKEEGDLKTPEGVFYLRYIMYRSDKIKKPKTNLPTYIIKKNHICCDDPKNSFYNKILDIKNSNLTEKLWRKDILYDILIVIGYNDGPIIKGKGSAIFLHLCEKKYKPTKGCIAIEKKNMIKLLKCYPKKIRIC